MVLVTWSLKGVLVKAQALDDSPYFVRGLQEILQILRLEWAISGLA